MVARVIDRPVSSSGMSASMGKLTPDLAVASLNATEDRLEGMAVAGQRSKTGTPSTLEFIAQWRERILKGDMSPDALPGLYLRQAARHAHASRRVHDVLADQAHELAALSEEPSVYGARWWFRPS